MAKRARKGWGMADAGWFVVNVRDTAWERHDTFGAGCGFQTPGASFEQLGINISVLQPGEPLCLYHRESNQEDFLVLLGECRLLVDGEERSLRAWDFFHCPPHVDHVFVGAGDGPCAILAVGARSAEEEIVYPVSELAARYGASVEVETPSPKEAYARYGQSVEGRPDCWDSLPWA